MSDRGQHTPSPIDPTASPADQDLPISGHSTADAPHRPPAGKPGVPSAAGSPAVPLTAAPDATVGDVSGSPMEDDPSAHAEDAPGDDVPFEIGPAGDGEGHTPYLLAEPEQDTPQPEKSSARTIVLASLLVVALAGAGTLGWFGWRVNSQRHTTLSTPSKIGALTLDDSEQATATADYLQSALSAEITMDKAVGAVYTGNDEKTVLFFGGTTLLWSPEDDLDSAFDLVSDDQSAVTEVKEIDAGELGGTMKCGVTHTPGEGDLTVCGWADHGSLALAMFANRTEAEAGPLMRVLRAAVQTRS